MELGLKNKVALVLASSKGIGRAIATKFALEGAKVMITSRDKEQLQQTADEIKQETNQDVSFYCSDVTNVDSIKELVKETVKKYGTIDILINNSGGPPAGKFEDFEDKDWYYAFELNLLSYIRSIREVLPYMKKQGKGKILNIASSSFKEPIEGLILSNTFRTGVVGLAKSLSSELGRDQILINTLGPGRIETERIASLEQTIAKDKGVNREEIKSEIESSIPVGRYGQPDEFANIAVFLCSDANTYVTGQAFLVDGGKGGAL